jgi:hypothetical protein
MLFDQFSQMHSNSIKELLGYNFLSQWELSNNMGAVLSLEGTEE